MRAKKNQEWLSLINDLIKARYLRTNNIIKAFKSIDRADFVPDNLQFQAYFNIPLSIGYGQTISQPLTVAFMLELLQPKAGETILDIGAGSGWQTAILAYIVSKSSNNYYQESFFNRSRKKESSGKVIAIELIPELVEFARNNLSKYNFIKKGIVDIICGDANKDLPKGLYFDKIIAAASAKEVPQFWKKRLKIGGRLVLPVNNSLLLLIKKSKTKFKKYEYPGFIFVPLISSK